MVDKTVSGVQPEEQWQGAEYQIAGNHLQHFKYIKYIKLEV